MTDAQAFDYFATQTCSCGHHLALHELLDDPFLRLAPCRVIGCHCRHYESPPDTAVRLRRMAQHHVETFTGGVTTCALFACYGAGLPLG